MGTHTAYKTCPWCNHDVVENEEAILVEKVVGVDWRIQGYQGFKPAPEGKLRINHIGGKKVTPKNLFHTRCWNQMLELLNVDPIIDKLKVW